MKRSIFLLVASIFSVTFLLVQLFFFKGINEQRSREPQKLRLAILEKFFSILKNKNVKFFIFDENLLKNVIAKRHIITDGKDCLVLCQTRKIVIGVGETLWNPQVSKELGNVGFNVKEFTDVDPRLNTVDQIVYSTIPVGYQVSDRDIVFIVHILYQRNGYYWWKGIKGGQSGILQNLPSLIYVQLDGISFSVPVNIEAFLTDFSQSKYIECNVDRAREFHSKYRSDNSPEAIQFEKHAKDILTLAVSILKQLNIRYWLSSGTCLGWFRQCGVIPHSKDVDLGIFIKDYKPGLIETFKEQGLFLKHVFGKVEDSFELSFRRIENNVKLDIFFFYEEENYMWNGGTRARNGMKYKYIFPKFTLCWSELVGLLIRVPCQTESYIEANYGKDWYKPIKEWKWNESPPNVQENGQWSEKEWPNVIQLYEIV